MISALIGRDGTVTVTSRTVVWPNKEAFASNNNRGNVFSFTSLAAWNFKYYEIIWPNFTPFDQLSL